MATYETRHVYVISWDTANTDLTYFCSNPDQVLDGVAAADIFYGDIINASTHSQGLNPIRANASIGSISFTFLDDNKALTALLNSQLIPSGSPLSTAQGLRAKRVQHWIGEKGAEWSGGYDLIQTQQINDSIQVVNNGNGYRFTGRDIQRSELEDIFDPKKTNLTASLSKTGITINVNSTADIELIQHGASYSDAPNELVGYIRVKDEKVRFTSKTSNTFTVDNAQSTLNGAVAKNAVTIAVTDASDFQTAGIGYIVSGSPAVTTEIKWTGISASPANTLTGVTGVTSAHGGGSTIVNAKGRGVLGTIAAEYSVDTSQPVSNRTKVEENIYYELPALKLAYAILTGNLYGSSPASSIPSHHSLGISTDWISTSQFTQFTDDLWNPADDASGVILRFDGLKKINAKKFIEEELLFWTGTFTPILNTGELGLKRMTGVLSDAAHSGIWNEDNVINVSSVKFDLNDIHNNVSILWNYDSIAKDYTRSLSVLDSDSQGKWGKTKTLDLKSKGLHGSIHTDNILNSMFNMWRDRYSGPPIKASIVLDNTQRGVKVGDIKRLQLDHIPEFTDQDGNYSSLDASVEVQRISVNHTNGTVTAEVFGSTQKAVPLALGGDNSPIDDAWFISEGIDISTVTTNTITGGGTICTIDGASSISGVDDLSSASPNGIYYWDGDLNVSALLNITKNVEIRVNGFLTFNSAGKIDGKGAGLTGGTTGQVGAIGNSQAGGGLIGSSKLADTHFGWTSTESDLVKGLNSARPVVVLVNDGGANILNKPTNGMGTSGGKGGDLSSSGTLRQAGSNGGNGGASLTIFCKGASGVSGSSIDLSGDDGAAGVIYTAGDPDGYAGSGAGGQAGILNLFLIGNTVTETLSDFFVAVNGATPIIGNPISAPGNVGPNVWQEPLYSHYTGIAARDVSRANLLVDWVPDNLTATADAAEIADTPTLISFAENSNVPQTPAENLATIDVSVTPPSDASYSHSNISYKLSSDAEAQFQRLPYPAKNETTVVLPMDGTEYTFRAFPVNIDGIESAEFIEKNFTLSSALGYVGSLTDEKYIQYDAAGTADLVLGQDAQIRGASSYNNLSRYYHTFFDSIDAFSKSTTGGSAILAGNSLSLKLGTGASDSFDLRKVSNWNIDDSFISYDNDIIRAKLRINFSRYSDANYRFGVGQIDGTTHKEIAFRVEAGTVYGYTGDGSSFTKTATGDSVTADHLFEFVFDGTDVKFYFDGTLTLTISTTLPTGATSFLFGIWGQAASAGSADGISTGELKVLLN